MWRIPEWESRYKVCQHEALRAERHAAAAEWSNWMRLAAHWYMVARVWRQAAQEARAEASESLEERIARTNASKQTLLAEGARDGEG